MNAAAEAGTGRAAAAAGSQNKRVMKKPKAFRGMSSTANAARRKATSTTPSKKKVQIVEPIQNQSYNVLADGRKFAEVEKRIGALMQHKEKLKERTDKLNGELNKTKDELNMTQQERGRFQQFWRIAESGLEEERERTRQVEKSVFEMKTEQAKQVQRLQQHIRSLVFHAKIHRNSSTQSEPIPPSGPQRNAHCQTMEELTKEKASDILRQSDDLLAAFIAELEKEKLEAQSELKYAVVHLEQRMKEEQETQMQTMKDEREIEIEEIGLKHMEQLRTVEAAHNEQVFMMQGKIDFLTDEASTLRDLRDSLSADLVDSREKLKEQAVIMGQQNANIVEMSKEISRLQDYKRNFQRDMRNVDNMRKEVAKYKELNEIIMGEFGKLEKERDELLAEVEKNIGRLEITNQRKYDEIGDRGRNV